MSTSLRADVGATVTHVLAKMRERVVKGMTFADYSNWTASGVTLASAKIASIGIKLPQDLSKGQVALRQTLRVPLAAGADGRTRFADFDMIAFLPADITADEKTILSWNHRELVGGTEWYTDAFNFKVNV